MAKIINFAKAKKKKIKERSQEQIVEFLHDAGVHLEKMKMDVEFDDGGELEIIFEPEEESNDS